MCVCVVCTGSYIRGGGVVDVPVVGVAIGFLGVAIADWRGDLLE